VNVQMRSAVPTFLEAHRSLGRRKLPQVIPVHSIRVGSYTANHELGVDTPTRQAVIKSRRLILYSVQQAFEENSATRY
jgi:hypothetical protein